MSIECTEICPDLGACCRIFCAVMHEGKEATRTMLKDTNSTFREIGELENKLLLTCDAIGSDGKCSQYETRPPTCSNFQPYTDGLCCLFVGPPNKDSITVTHADLVNKYRYSNTPPSL